MEDKYSKLLNMIQNDLPMESRPFLSIAEKMEKSEDEVLDMIKELKEQGYIRRFGGTFDSKNLGYTGTLCGMEVTENKIEEVAHIVNSYTNVTHNYLRNHKYNMWFTLIEPSQSSLDNHINEIKTKTGIDEILVLNSLRTFKINVKLNVEGA
ncbi:Lrp/AsnC family transcriptional regulator [Anaerocolumna sedimenticola]|uniref:siroheme decarboxylase n=1 Tax=Anaerocolumna sedimenticola TaxID=2696063 RepID=A0A6P1TS66_9FIRM|nr:Lrp/AsnC family transcriptional regulator [Anaerocolumna sedimenticola]QHQ63102.1 Lrp/AsnC family transcriptional regulator [Anaerocolumna sedimenticola]